MTFVRQLVKLGRKPEFGPIKNDKPRTVGLGPETVALLREHKRMQAELKMRNRVSYHDLGMVFAKEWGDLHRREDSLGLPLQSNNSGQREFARIIKAAEGAAYYHPRTEAYERNATAEGKRAASSRPAQTRTQAD